MAHQIQIKELVNGIEITENLDGVVVVKLLSYNSRPFFRTTNETDEESYQVLDRIGEIYHLPALATEFVLIDLEGNYWQPDNGTELIEYSYKIRAFRPENEFDRVLSLGAIETTANSLTANIPGIGLTNSFLINGSIYELYYPSLFNFSPIVGVSGEQKILILYAKPDTQILYLVQGAEALEAIEPNYDGLFVARIIVNAEGQVVEEDDNDYKLTSSDGWRTFQIASNDPFVIDMGNSYASSFAIDVLPGVTAPKIGLIRQKAGKSFWDGSPFFFRNVSGVDISFVEESYTDTIFIHKTFEPTILKAGLDKEFKLRNNVLSEIKVGEETSDLTLEQARQNGNVLEGNVEFAENEFIGFKIPQSDDLVWGFFRGDGDRDTFGNKTDDKEYGLEIKENYTSIYARKFSTDKNLSFLLDTFNNEAILTISGESKGILGSNEFDKQGDRKAFAQLSDVYDPEALIQLLSDADSTQLETIKGLLGIV